MSESKSTAETVSRSDVVLDGELRKPVEVESEKATSTLVVPG